MGSYCQLFESPVGTLMIKADETNLNELNWAKELPLGFMEKPNATTQQVADQLNDYFNKSRKDFDLKIEFNKGTEFQQKVWRLLADIPSGKTWTYKQVAEKLNSSPRAVGGAVGANPVPIILPCHRVVGENGMMTGFSGGDGIPTKKKLLALEGVL